SRRHTCTNGACARCAQGVACKQVTDPGPRSRPVHAVRETRQGGHAGMGGKREDISTSGVGARSGALAPTSWFGVPTVPADYVRRLRLFQVLDAGATAPLILVSGPAGSGKTSLVADWVSLRASDEQTEWVTFEREDEAIWPGVLGGLARLGIAVPSRSLPEGTDALDRQLLTGLAMAVANAARPVTLVLDG